MHATSGSPPKGLTAFLAPSPFYSKGLVFGARTETPACRGVVGRVHRSGLVSNAAADYKKLLSRISVGASAVKDRGAGTDRGAVKPGLSIMIRGQLFESWC